MLEDILSNHVLVNAVLGWTLAQVLKTLIHAIVNRGLDIKRLFGDGGMPSGHSATVTAMAATAGFEYGLGSTFFAISAILAIVVMHDAMGVRREAGRHAKALNELLAAMGDSRISDEEKLKEFLGHTPSQVCVGAILGFLIAFILH